MGIMIKAHIYLLCQSICAGICISLGCMTFLLSPDKISGSILFSVGLLGVVIHSFNLFTGSICSFGAHGIGMTYEIVRQCFILFSNVVGTLIASIIFLNTGIETGVSGLVDNKLSADLLAVFCKAVFCNILICLAVDEWKKQKNSLIVIFAVTAFVLCGFEHCVANAFYMLTADKFCLSFFIVNVVGNAIGGISFWRLKYLFEEELECLLKR